MDMKRKNNLFSIHRKNADNYIDVKMTFSVLKIKIIKKKEV